MGTINILGVEVPNPLQTLQEGISGGVNWITDAINSLPRKISEGIANGLSWLRNALESVGADIATSIRDGLIDALDWLEDVGGWISTGLDRLGETVGRFLDDAITRIGGALTEIGKFLEPLTTRLGQFIDRLASGIIDKLAAGFNWIVERLTVAFEAFRPVLEGIVTWIGQRLEAVINALTPYMQRIGEWLYSGVKTAIDSVASWLHEHKQEIASYIANAIKAVHDLLQPLILAFSELGQALIEQLQKAFNPEMEDLKASYKQMFEAYLELQAETARAIAGA